MDNIKLAQHEIEAAKIWREAGDVDRALLHLEYALGYLQDDNAAQQAGAVDGGDADEFEEVLAQLDPHVSEYIRETRRN